MIYTVCRYETHFAKHSVYFKFYLCATLLHNLRSFSVLIFEKFCVAISLSLSPGQQSQENGAKTRKVFYARLVHSNVILSFIFDQVAIVSRNLRSS